jgi:hypothetical protein
MQSLRTMANRMWPILAAAVLSLTLFWGIAIGAQPVTRWLLTHAVRHSVLLPEATFFGAFLSSMVTFGARRRRKQAHRELPRRDWLI